MPSPARCETRTPIVRAGAEGRELGPTTERAFAICGAAADQAIAACGGDARETVKALLVTVDFLEARVDELRAAVSTGYARRRYDVRRDRKE
jgi:hypothetical protein